MTDYDFFGRNADVSFNGDWFFVKTLTVAGPLVADPIGVDCQLPSDSDNYTLGQAVMDALSVSRIIYYDDDPDIYENIEQRYRIWISEMMKKYSYRTKKALFQNMLSCGVCCNKGVVTIRPSLHEKLEWWSGKGINESDYVVIPDTSTPAEVGAAVRLAFTRCKTGCEMTFGRKEGSH